jgi:hypothetical protein
MNLIYFTCTEKNSLSYRTQKSEKILYFGPVRADFLKNGFFHFHERNERLEVSFIFHIVHKKNHIVHKKMQKNFFLVCVDLQDPSMFTN